nr:transcription factor tcp14 [Quercus suber]
MDGKLSSSLAFVGILVVVFCSLVQHHRIRLTVVLAKQETLLDVSDCEGRVTKRRPVLDHQQEMSQNQMGGYLLQSSNSGSINPGTFWMLTNPNPSTTQVMSGGHDPMWTFPSSGGGGGGGTNSGAGMYRGSIPMSSGLHFMNFAPPVALLPSQQFGQLWVAELWSLRQVEHIIMEEKMDVKQVTTPRSKLQVWHGMALSNSGLVSPMAGQYIANNQCANTD